MQKESFQKHLEQKHSNRDVGAGRVKGSARDLGTNSMHWAVPKYLGEPVYSVYSILGISATNRYILEFIP